MWLISLSRRQSCSTNLAPTRKASTALLPYQLSPVSTPLTCTFTVERFTIGALVDTPKTALFAMVSASGLWLVWDQLPSMFPSQATTSSATARWAQMPPSAMALINLCSVGFTNSIVATGAWMVLPPSGFALGTGCSPSTNESHFSFLSWSMDA